MDEQFLPLNKVVELTSLSRGSIDRMSAAGEFVRPIYLSPRRKVSPRSAVLAWMQAQMERDDG
jgi:predicted DNA-binding transcriptional regulator AlpA